MTQLKIGEKNYPIARGPMGNVLSIGNVLYGWNQNGQVTSIQNEHGSDLTDGMHQGWSAN